MATYTAQILWYDYCGGDDVMDVMDFETYEEALKYIDYTCAGRGFPSAWINGERVKI